MSPKPRELAPKPASKPRVMGRPRSEESRQRILDAATAVSPEIIPLVHGGPFHDPASTGIIYRETSAVGFVAASAVERIPVENAIREVCEQYKSLRRP